MKSFISTVCLVIVPMFCTGCLLPYYYPASPSTRIMEASDFVPGITTKAEVFLRFGNSFSISPDEKKFQYFYTTNKGHYGVMAGIPGDTGAIHGPLDLVSYHVITITFDDNGVVTSCADTFSQKENPPLFKNPF